MQRKYLTTFLIGVFFITLLSNCSNPTPVSPTATPMPPTSTATAVPNTPTPVPTSTTPITRGKVDIGPYKLNIFCKGEGRPAIVINPQGPLDYLLALFANIPEEIGSRVCIHDRVGLGQSDPAPYEPRTSLDMAEDLHQLLTIANIPGPYILVAHDHAGFITLLFADQYPDDVAGMILIDVVHPDWHTRVWDIFPSETGDDQSPLTRYRNEFTSDSLDTFEFLDIPASEQLVREAGELGDLPLVVMTRDTTESESQQSLWGDDFPLDISTKMDAIWLELQEDLATLSTNSQHIVVEGTNHMLPRQNPESVVEAIEWVLGEVRGE